MPLSRRQTATLGAFLSGGTVSDIARSTSVPESTLRRWLAEPDFADALTALIEENLENTLRENTVALSECAPLSVASIRRILENPSQVDPEVTLRAANIVLDKLLKLGEYRRGKRKDDRDEVK